MISGCLRIAANRAFEGFIHGYGVGFHSIDVDFESLHVDPDMVKKAQKADNVLKMFLSFRKLEKYAVPMVGKYHEACVGSDVIVYHPGLGIGHFMAERMGIPSVLASPFPLHKTSVRPSVILYGKVKPNRLVNRRSYDVLQGMLWMASASSLKAFWKERYGELPAHFGNPFERHADSRHPAIVSCSNHVFGRPGDWNENVHQKGYWFVEEPSEYVPSPELAAFLSKGEKPVYVGFGSMFDKDGTEKVARVVVDGLARAGKRGVLNGMGGLTGLPDTVLAVDGVPHSWLFVRMAAVCHHGGAGTTAAGFRAGVPSVIIPFALDQHAWARRACELGVGSRLLPARKLTADGLAEAIRFAARDDVVEKARALGESIAAEKGARECAQVIAATMEGSRNAGN